MNGRAIIPGVAVALAGGLVLALYLTRSSPAPSESIDRIETPPTAANTEPVATPSAALPAEPARRPRAAPAEANPTSAAAPEPLPEPAPSVGAVRVESDVAGAQVFIDRQFIGATPVFAPDVTPGRHQLNVSAEGFESFVDAIDVTPGEQRVMVRFREVRLDASLEVIHKHGIGSCRGRLVATPQGLRYDTTNRDDQFVTPLTTLDTFEVDYLEKNLRVKLPRGKQYNFTDPEGNADRLFVFHRDVNAARERLQRGDPPAGGR